MRLQIPILSLVVAMLCAGIQLPTLAQQQPPPNARKEREQRIAEHEERIREIINQRRQTEIERRDALEAREKELAALDAYRAEQGPVRRALGSVMLYINFPTAAMPRQLDRFVTEGTQFVSEVILLNEAVTELESMRIALTFDKRFLRPVRVFDTRIRHSVEGEPTFIVNDRDGIIQYDATFSSPIAQPELTVLTIVWEALRPTAYTSIGFVLSPEELADAPHTAVRVMDRNILGIHFDPIDGVLSGGILIEEKLSPSGAAPRLQGKAEELRTMYLGSIGARSKAGLHLVAPEEPIHVGDIFPVHVHLENPLGTLVDTVDFMISWNPDLFEVVDRDRLNSIRSGVNAWDGPYRADYPFDYLKTNDGEVRRGYLRYSASLGDGRSLPTGTFATIFLRARQATTGGSVQFLRARPGMPNLTSIRYFGYEIISFDPPWSIPEVSIAVANAPTGYETVDYSKAMMEALKPAEPAPEVAAEEEPPPTEVQHLPPVQELGIPR